MNTNRWVVTGLAVLALGCAGLIGGATATVHAAGTAASAFELVVDARLTPPHFVSSEGGTFRSKAPFCASGTFIDGASGTLVAGASGMFNEVDPWFRFTCDDGTGGLTFAVGPNATWWIAEGSGSYAGLRGRGTLRGEQLCGGSCDLGRPIPWRGTLLGVVDRDAVAPTVFFSSATATKLPRPAGAYALRLGLTVRDDVTDNPVSYIVRVCAYTVDACAGPLVLARTFGTATGATSITLRIRRPVGARTVQLQLEGEDPLGNAVLVRRELRLPR